MTLYLMDSNACIGWLRQREPKLIARIKREPPGNIVLCSVVVSELYYGAERSGAAYRASNILGPKVSKTFHAHFDSQTVARRPDRPQRIGQEHLRATALLADRDPLVRRLPGDGQRRREQSGRHEGRLRGAALHRRQAAGAGAADGHRRHERAARGPQAARRSWPGSTTACRSPSC